MSIIDSRFPDCGVTALGSGSRGNAFLIHCGGDSLLIDAGFSRAELCRRMEQVGVDPASVRAVLLTHEHEDHSRGIRVFCDQLDIPLCASGRTVEYLRGGDRKLPCKVLEFQSGEPFRYGVFHILPFSVRHDAIDPVGFRISVYDHTFGVATDIGLLTQLAADRLTDCDALIFESNYDQQMLVNSDRSLSLKRRIMGHNGHLNNVDSMAALARLLTERTQLVLFAHISRECNDYNLVRTLAKETFSRLGRHDIDWAVVEQEAPLPTFSLHGFWQKTTRRAAGENLL